MSSLNARSYWGYGDAFTKDPRDANFWSSRLAFQHPNIPDLKATEETDLTVSTRKEIYDERASSIDFHADSEYAKSGRDER